MKKKKIIIEIVVSLSLIILLAVYSMFIFKINGTKTYALDISQFRGLISDSVDFENSVAKRQISMSEALKLGDEAVLSYKNYGIKIWAPDHKHPGLYYYFEMRGVGGSINYSFFLEKDKLIVKEDSVTLKTIMAIIFVIIFFVTTWKCHGTVEDVITYRKMQKKPLLVDRI